MILQMKAARCLQIAEVWKSFRDGRKISFLGTVLIYGKVHRMKDTRKKYLSALVVLLFLFLLTFLILYLKQKDRTQVQEAEVEEGGQTEEKSLYAGTARWLEENLSEIEEMERIQPVIQEEMVYSFLQGPRSWSEGIPWSGEWSEFEVEGNPFGGFGCGLCCMANIYNTLSPYEVSPWDMFEHAKIASDYKPGGEYGAIDWEAMGCALSVCGIRNELHTKPRTYEEFQQQVRNAKSAIVLVSSGNDDSFWTNTPGHYVNIWLYQEDGTVFLAEPGNPENNRLRIPLRYIYDALKTVSRFQYLLVKDYVHEDNRWRANGINENWNRP